MPKTPPPTRWCDGGRALSPCARPWALHHRGAGGGGGSGGGHSRDGGGGDGGRSGVGAQRRPPPRGETERGASRRMLRTMGGGRWAATRGTRRAVRRVARRRPA
eukprot:7378162-Prymnesium_polylepis.2